MSRNDRRRSRRPASRDINPSVDVTEYPHINNLADPQRMYQMVQTYLTYMDVKNYAKSTRDSREFYLYTFLEWAGQRDLIRPSEITKPILDRFQRHLFHYRKSNGDPLAFRSQYNRLVAIRAWFKWLTKENISCTTRPVKLNYQSWKSGYQKPF